jgi:hypothetical protein
MALGGVHTVAVAFSFCPMLNTYVRSDRSARVTRSRVPVQREIRHDFDM